MKVKFSGYRIADGVKVELIANLKKNVLISHETDSSGSITTISASSNIIVIDTNTLKCEIYEG